MNREVDTKNKQNNDKNKNNNNQPRQYHFPSDIEYSEKYFDDVYEYRHVLLSEEVYEKMPKRRLLSEAEWRGLGVKQSLGWIHYEIYGPEPFILLFRRPLNFMQNAMQHANKFGIMKPQGSSKMETE